MLSVPFLLPYTKKSVDKLTNNSYIQICSSMSHLLKVLPSKLHIFESFKNLTKMFPHYCFFMVHALKKAKLCPIQINSQKCSPVLKFLSFVILSCHTLILVLKLYRTVLLSKYNNQTICDIGSDYCQ